MHLMNNGVVQVPVPVNECVYEYRPDSPEKTSIKKALARYAAEGGTFPICTNTVQTCVGAILVPTYLPTLPTDPINTGSHIYRYAGGYRKTGATTYSNTGSTNDYILGVRGEAGGTNYSGWGLNDLTILEGS